MYIKDILTNKIKELALGGNYKLIFAFYLFKLISKDWFIKIKFETLV